MGLHVAPKTNIFGSYFSTNAFSIQNTVETSWHIYATEESEITKKVGLVEPIKWADEYHPENVQDLVIILSFKPIFHLKTCTA